MKYQGKNGEYFEVISVDDTNCHVLKESAAEELSMFWFESDGNSLSIDSVQKHYNTDDLLFLTEFHKVEVVKVHKVKVLKFNRPFYCILDHDSEVGCRGILYYGAKQTPTLHPDELQLETLQAVWKMLELEMVSRDNLQLEMLQMMLKRILILCTRIYKSQKDYNQLETQNVDLIRDFNFLVEQHFKQHHSVSEYAELLFKSPKTLSNVFKKAGEKSPLQFIQARIMIEARRLLKYSDQNVSDIAYELGYNDVQTFSRFFKKNENISPADYRK